MIPPMADLQAIERQRGCQVGLPLPFLPMHFAADQSPNGRVQFCG